MLTKDPKQSCAVKTFLFSVVVMLIGKGEISSVKMDATPFASRSRLDKMK
jgi:hypothetical protein